MKSHTEQGDRGVAEVNGTRLYYEACGSGPALLFLHGFTLDHRMWKRQSAELQKAYRVITYDARGFGQSALPGPEPYRHYEDAAALCEYLGERQVIAVGHSIGAHQMLELSLSRPDLVLGWVSIGISGLASVPFPEDVMKLFGAVRKAAREESVEAAKEIWGQGGWFMPARRVPSLAAELDTMLADYSGWHWTHDNPAKGLEPPAAERLPELRAPALVISGGSDLPYNHAVRDMLIRQLKDARVLDLAHASHMANMEDPGAVNDAIAAFAQHVWSNRRSER